jgi:hypothetical protein
MNSSTSSFEKNGLLIGFITFLSLVSYFMIMKVLGLSQILELRFFNFVIIAAGIYFGINKFKRQFGEEDFYLKGLGQGIFISAVSVILFAFFMSIYLSYFDESLMQHIRETATLGFNVSTGLNIFFVIFIEGIAAGFIITFAAMQYLK